MNKLHDSLSVITVAIAAIVISESLIRDKLAII